MTGATSGRGSLGWFAPMLGVHGRVPDVFETLAPGLADRGFTSVCSSSIPERWRRSVDQARVLHAQRSRLDLVFVHVYSGPSFAVADLLSAQARRAGLPVVGYLSGGGLPDLWAKHPGWVRRVMARFDRINAPSPFLGRFVADDLHLPVMVIPNPVDMARFPFRARDHAEPSLLWMRAFHEVYRPEVAIRVLADLRRTHPHARLTMAGQDKGLLEPTRALARDLGVADAVSFPGFIGPDERLAALDSHDVFLHTNQVDNTPVSLLEAAASGLPIVASAVGGIPDLLADGTEALLAPDDAEGPGSTEGIVAGLADRVRRVVSDPSVAAGLSAAAHERVLAADVEVVLDRWEAVVGELLPGSARVDAPERPSAPPPG